MKKNKLDHVDCEILNLLSKNGRMSVKDLAMKFSSLLLLPRQEWSGLKKKVILPVITPH